jgi:hypothetical protein
MVPRHIDMGTFQDENDHVWSLQVKVQYTREKKRSFRHPHSSVIRSIKERHMRANITYRNISRGIFASVRL